MECLDDRAEAQAMAKLTHPNVTRVYDVGTIADGVFLAMELVQGRTLRARFAEEPRTWRAVVAMMRDAAAGVHAAHEAGLVHGDFKPDNVLVAHDGRVLVSDFGLARMVFAEPHTRGAFAPGALDATCGFAGTPAYMAPEQFDEAPVATAASDQFSFCVKSVPATEIARIFEEARSIPVHDITRRQPRANAS